MNTLGVAASYHFMVASFLTASHGHYQSAPITNRVLWQMFENLFLHWTEAQVLPWILSRDVPQIPFIQISPWNLFGFVSIIYFLY